MTELEKKLSGRLYNALDLEIKTLFLNCKSIVKQYNQTTHEESDKRKNLIKQLLKSSDETTYLEPPIFFDYGIHTSVGKNFYANTNLVVLDVCEVVIGDNVLLGPNVMIMTASHPLNKDIRNTGLEYGKPISIGNDVWIGGGVIINPGVTIGSNVVIGSGSVITKDIPSCVVAVGNPCRIIRHLTEEELIKESYNV